MIGRRDSGARGALVALVALATCAFAGSARADSPPTAWERAKSPESAVAYDLHRVVQRRLVQSRRFETDDAAVRGVLTMLRQAGAETSKDVRLRFDLATAYFILPDYPRAAELFKAALADAPDHPAAEEGWLRLAFACGHTGDHECERKAYIEVLRRTTEEIWRATPTLNLAETEMHLGNLREAVEGYREALRLAGRTPQRDTAPLAVWGLAVALDRSGDRPVAEKEARFALELERSMNRPTPLLHTKDVFFVPAYEVNYYDGLGAVARARVAASAREAVGLWRVAEQHFGAYVKAAESAKQKDRWLDHAKARLAAAKAEREKAEKRAPKEPVRAPVGEDLEFKL